MKKDDLSNVTSRQEHSLSSPRSICNNSGDSYYELWFKDLFAHHPMFKIVPATVLAGLLSGIIAVIGAFFRPEGPWLVILNIFFFSPFMEELFKQIGLIYLLEKRTWLLRFTWQFPLAGALSGLTFAVLENLIYRYHHLADMDGIPLDRLHRTSPDLLPDRLRRAVPCLETPHGTLHAVQSEGCPLVFRGGNRASRFL